jgi:hypothetical protein
MAQFTAAVIKEKARLTFVGRRENDQLIQDLLISASYHAMKGNTNPFNDILAEAVASKTTKLEGLNRWIKDNVPVIHMDKGSFKMVKGWTASEVKDEAEFEAKILPQLKAAPTWWEVAPKVNAQKEWDVDTYLNGVINTLKKHGQDAAANEILAAKAKLVAA